MKLMFTYLLKYGKMLACILSFIYLTQINNISSAQTRNYVTTAEVKANTVDNPNNAILNNGTPATVRSSGALIGGYAGELELRFPGLVDANTTTFIRVDFEPDLLNALLGGNLGSALANVVGSLVLGDHSIEVGARNGSVNGTSGSSSGGFSTTNLRLVRDAGGLYYVAITPTAQYDRVYIRDVTKAALLGGLNNTKVYNAFYFSGAGSCDPAFATDFDGSGLTASVLGIGKAGVTDMQNAIDNSSATFSQMGLGLVTVGGSISQNIYFNSPSAAGDDANVKLSVTPSLANLGLLNRISIGVYKGNNLVTSFSDFELLDLDVLNLLKSGQPANVKIPASSPFDRVTITLQSLAGANVNQTVNVYHVTRSAAMPTLGSPSASNVTACVNAALNLSAVTASTNQLVWYDVAEGGTALAVKEYNESYSPIALVNKIYYVAARKKGCTEESARVAINVTVTPAPITPVLVNATITTCSGSDAVLQIKDPIVGLTYKWYNAAGVYQTGKDGTTFTATGVTANTTYTVEAVNSCNTASAKATATIQVGTLDSPVVATASVTVSPGAVAVLTATSSTANALIRWYATAASTTILHTGTTFVTPTLTQNTTYYVEATISGGCSSARVPVTVTVGNDGTPGPTPCGTATQALADGVEGVALFAGVFNAGLAVDDKAETGSSLVMPVGALNAYVYQRVGFTGGLSNVGDVVRVRLTSPGKLLSLGVLPAIQVLTYKGGTSNNDLTALTNPLISLELLSDQSAVILSFIPTAQFDGVEIRLNSGVVGALTSVNLNYAQRVVAVPEVTASAVTSCLNQTTTLSVKNPKANLTYKWYDAAGVYQTGKDGVSFVTPVITANTKFSVAATSSSNCSSERVTIDVTVGAAPTTPVLVNATITTCANSDVVLQVKDPVVGLTYKWYNAAGVYQTGKDGTSYTVTGVTANTTYTVEAVNSCNIASTKATATIQVGTLDSPVVATASVTVSPGAVAVLTATSSTANALIRWYATAASTTILHTGTTFVTPTLTQNTTYYVEAAISGGCSSARVPVTVTVGNDGTPGPTPCGTATQALADGVSGVALFAGVFNAGLAVDDKAETASSLVMPVGALNAYVYQRVGFTGGLSNVGDTVRIRLTSPGKLLSLAVLPAIQVLTYKGGTSNNDLTALTNPLISLELLSDQSAVMLSFVPTAQFDGVEIRLNSGLVGALTSVNLNYAQKVGFAPKVAVASTTACQGTSAVLSVSNPIAGATYKWYLENVYQTGKDGATFTTLNTLPLGVYNYFVTATINGCESSRTKVTVTVVVGPALPVVSSNGTLVCAGTSTTLSVQNAQAGVSYQWFADATNNTVLFTGATFTTPTLNASTDYYVRALATTGCTGTTARVKVTVTLTTQPGLPTVALTTINGCIGSTATINVTNPVAGVTYTYYSSAVGGTALGTGNSFTTPAITSSLSYFVEASVGNNCTSNGRTQVTVTATTSPVAPSSVTASSNALCTGSTVVLTVNNPDANLNYKWYTTSTGGTALFEGNVYTSAPLTTTTTFYVESVAKTGLCASSTRTAVTVTINPILATPVVTVQTVTNSSIQFAWNAVQGATGYETSVNAGATWQAATGTSYLAANLTAGQSVTLIVRAKGQINCQTSANSTPTTGKTDDPLGAEIYVPNTFTPNNDGMNDVFMAYSKSVTRFKMSIFNQWGQLITEVQSISQGWDGTHKGEMQPSGVYVYGIDATFADGTTKKLRGTVTLLR